MTTYTASNAASLTAALSTVHAGDTISLAAGNYGDLRIDTKNFTSDVTITSADPTHAAIFSTITVDASSHIKFDDVNVKFTPTAATQSFFSAVMIEDSQNVTFTRGAVTGGPAVNGVPQTATQTDATDNVLGLPTGRGFTVLGSSNVTISGSNVSAFDRGMALGNSDHVTVSGNDIHDLRRTAILGGANDLVIDGNHLHDGHPWAADHADFIALFTNAAQTSATTNVTVTNNVMEQGAGTPILGMWMQGGTAGFSNVTIQGNAILGGNHQGIYLWDVHGGTISGNALVQTDANQPGPDIALNSGVSSIAVSGNFTNGFTDLAMGGTGNTLTHNTLLQTTGVTADGYLSISNADALHGLAPAIVAAVGSEVLHVIDTTIPVLTASSLVAPAATTTAATAQTTVAIAGKVLLGTYQNDNLVGASGSDTLNGNNGSDTLTGGAGNDLYYVPNGLAKVVEAAGGGTDTIIAKGDHTLEANVENLVISNDGSPNGWSGTGNGLNNVIIGNSLNNTISGLEGNDTLDGGMGSDSVNGGGGNDMLLGGAGNDLLTGGAGADTFVFSTGFGSDKVADFSRAQGDTVLVVGGSYTVSQVGADTVIKLSGGDQMTLTGVDMHTLSAGWISHVGSLFGMTVPFDTVFDVTENAAPVAAPIADAVADTPVDPVGIVTVGAGLFGGGFGMLGGPEL